MSSASKPSCPICKNGVAKPPENEWFPFCSSRCKVLDLSKWLNNEYTVPAVEDDESDIVSTPNDAGERLH
jgi:endogenous inhibitor of DNA gyrase (YacG/DUF329 family)